MLLQREGSHERGFSNRLIKGILTSFLTLFIGPQSCSILLSAARRAIDRIGLLRSKMKTALRAYLVVQELI